jgi:hypothetical protein
VTGRIDIMSTSAGESHASDDIGGSFGGMPRTLHR